MGNLVGDTLQTPCNTLQTPLKHPSTPFKQPSKSSFFSFKKWSGKKINRDFIKGGRGGGSPFYEVVSQKIFFFTNDGFPKLWPILWSCWRLELSEQYQTTSAANARS